MKKKFLVIILSALSLLQKVNAHQIKAGFEIGLNIATFRFSPPVSAFNSGYTKSSRLGYKVGGVLTVPISNHFSLEPALYYSLKGLTITGNGVEARYFYRDLEIPLLVGYHIQNVVIAAGPYLGCALSAKVELYTSGNTQSANIPIGKDASTSSIRRMDAGLNLKGKYEMSSGWFFALQYGFGLTNLEPRPGVSEKHSVWCFSMGHLFSKKAILMLISQPGN